MDARKSVIVVEDEPLAAATLRDFIGGVPWMRLVAEASDGNRALEFIEQLRPEVLFLDVRLPELDGINLLSRVSHSAQVIFTTAYDDYAVTAFELGAIDYLLKPFSESRFRVAVERLKTAGHSDVSPQTRLSHSSVMPIERLFASKRNEVVPIHDAEIIYVQADGDYAQLFTADDQYLIHVSLGELTRRLDPRRFFRVHRSIVVNLDHVARMAKEDDGRARIVLKNGRTLRASRSGTRELFARFEL